ncbi:CXXC-20-CXXC protein [Bacillus pakistanensis]|uniref:CXXC-20-CXXC protein n=2 Tax=Rossellomorea pakistanensis TaxID=992288 RepID=A0ABS2NC07_9BACI|nr:CXXC-20-CXXC protein [Bacillus pakistanensis]
MPVCQNCGFKWSWRETFIKMFTFKNKLLCSSCNAHQYLSKKSRNQLSLFAFLPFLIWIPLVSSGVPFGYVLTLEFILYALVLVYMPYLYKLSNIEEPMW